MRRMVAQNRRSEGFAPLLRTGLRSTSRRRKPRRRRGGLAIFHRGAVVDTLERLAQRAFGRWNRMFLEKLLDLRLLLARAERTDRSRDARNALEDAEQLGQRVPIRLDERPRGIARPGF